MEQTQAVKAASRAATVIAGAGAAETHVIIVGLLYGGAKLTLYQSETSIYNELKQFFPKLKNLNSIKLKEN